MASSAFLHKSIEGGLKAVINQDAVLIEPSVVESLLARTARQLTAVQQSASWPLKSAWLACLMACKKFSATKILDNASVAEFLASLLASAENPATKSFLEEFSSCGTQSVVKGPVCVTGANGFLGAHLVLQLLEAGYTVHGTVRDSADSAKSAHLMALPGATERLKLFECDLMAGKESFKAAMQGCSGVYHTASPFFTTGYDDGQKALIEPAVQGTQAVLGAVLDTMSVKRVVLTSSTASVYIDQRPADHVYDEDDWSDLQYVQAKGMHYVESKIRAELAAWAMIGPVQQQGERDLDLVVIAPTLIIGPMLQPSLNTSSKHILQLLDGSKSQLPDGNKCFVDVRDVASMHIKAMNNPKAEGRYLCIADSIPYTAVAKYIRAALPEALTTALPAASSDAERVAKPHTLWSKEKSFQLGHTFRPVEHSIADTVISLYLKGHMNSFLPEELKQPQGTKSPSGGDAASE